MKYKLILLLAAILIVLQFLLPLSAILLIPGIILVLLIRNPKSLPVYLKFLFPSLLFLLLFYSVLGQFQSGLKTVALLSGTSLSLQFYLAFFPEISLYELFIRTGIPSRKAFMLYGALNYVSFIRPLIAEIQEAQRLRGIDIPKGVRGLFHFHIILIPLMVRLLKGADHLAESLYLRSGEVDIK